MRFGLHALGIASGADPDVILAVAAAAESSGFATLWAGEHVVVVGRADSPYPYSPDGRIAVPATADWLDPWATLTFAASATSRIRLATGVLLRPEHNPLVVAKQATSLDVLSKGRFLLGVGIGWSAAEFAALGSDSLIGRDAPGNTSKPSGPFGVRISLLIKESMSSSGRSAAFQSRCNIASLSCSGATPIARSLG